jgi:predicted XRE-type DNA-binding protein
MNAEKRKALEAQGYKVYDHAGDAVGMTAEEKELMDIRITLAIEVRKRREKLKMSQKDLAVRLKTTQPRVAKIEQAASDVSFDHIYRAYAAVGGRIVVKGAGKGSGGNPPRKAAAVANGKRGKVSKRKVTV